MALYKRDGGNYTVSLWQDGIRTLVSTGTPNLRKAQEVERKVKDDLFRKRHSLGPSVDPNRTFGEIAAQYIGDAAGAYQIDRLNHVLPFFADVPVRRIDHDLAEQYRRYRRAEKPHLTAATLNHDIRVARRVLYWAMSKKLILDNPLARVPMERERRTKILILSVEEEELLLANAAPHLRPLIAVGLDTGLRRSELFRQQWADIDLARRVLVVSRSKTPEGEAREVPMTARVYALLSAISNPSGYLFTYEGKPLTSIKTTWAATVRRARIRHFPFKFLRHTFNTRLMEAGVVQDVREALMGHTGGRSRTNSRYREFNIRVLRKAIADLEQWKQQQGGSNDPGAAAD